MISQDFGNQGTPPLPISWFNNVSAIGGMFGGLSFGWVSDRFGYLSLSGPFALAHSCHRRRAAVAIASAVSIIGVLIQFVTPKHNNDMLLVGMLVNGFALGLPINSECVYTVQWYRSRHVCLICECILCGGISTCSAWYHNHLREPLDRL